MIIYSASLTLILCLLVGVLWAFLDTYEKNLPLRTAEKFVSELTDDGMCSLIDKTLGEINDFENSALILARSEFLNKNLTQSKLAKEYTAAVPVYRLISGETDVGKFTLRRKEKDAAFGVARWEIGEAILYPEAVPGGNERIDITICIPSGAKLFINDVLASTKYITEENVKYSGKAIVSGFNDDCDIYKISGLCTPPLLEAEFEGQKSTLSIKNGTSDWFSEAERAFMLTMPSDARLQIGGNESKAKPWGRGELSHAVTKFEKHLGDALPASVSYLVCGDPENISVKVHGQILNGEWVEDEGQLKNLVFLYSEESKYRVYATLPKGASLYINGVPAGDEYKKGEKSFLAYEGIEYISKNHSIQKGELYEIGGLLCEPVISAKIGDTEIPICSLTRDDQIFTAEFYGASDPSLSKGVESAAESFTKAYFHYVANGAVGIEENYGALISQMKSGSPGYKQISRSKSSFEFVNQGVYRIDRILPYDMISLSDNVFYCKVAFSVNLRFYKNEKQYEGILTLLFTEEDGKLLVNDMVIDSAS